MLIFKPELKRLINVRCVAIAELSINQLIFDRLSTQPYGVGARTSEQLIFFQTSPSDGIFCQDGLQHVGQKLVEVHSLAPNNALKHLQHCVWG